VPRVRKQGPGQTFSWSMRALNAATSVERWVQFWGSEETARAAWEVLGGTSGGCRLHGVGWHYDAPELDRDSIDDDDELYARRLEYLREHGITCPGRAKCCARDGAA